MLAFLLFAAAVAQGPAQPQDVPRDLLEASAEWGQCRGNVYAPLLQGPLSAEEIVDAALAACSAQERRLADVGVRHFGPEWRRIVADFRLRYRADMVAQVNELRSGGPVSDPSLAWGLCLGERGRSGAREEPEASIERAFAECAAHEDRVRARYEQRHGARSARTMMDQQRQVLRNRLVEEIRTGRR